MTERDRSRPSDDLDAWFGASGAMARAWPNYEDRPQQRAFARAVADAIAQQEVLLCEAGTGTGKTLAYLVPAVLSGRKVIVSTATRALQEQIVHKDIPALNDRLGFRANVVMLKGLSNYLCRRRFEEHRASIRTPHRSLAVVESWARETSTGDAAELAEIPEDDPIWGDVLSGSETRIGPTCAYHDECFVTRVRREAESAQIVVVNHHLYLADVALKTNAERSRAGVLPHHDVAIFDEAHRLEDVASEFFGVRISTAQIERLVGDAGRAFHAAGGETLASKLDRSAREVLDGATLYFRMITAGFPERVETRAPLDVGREVRSEVTDAYHRFDEALRLFVDLSEANARTDAIDVIRRRGDDIRQALGEIMDPSRGSVPWAMRKKNSVTVGASRIEVGDILRARVFSSLGGVVLTSATLHLAAPSPTGRASAPGAEMAGFAFLRSRLGLDDAFDAPVNELLLDSPFDLESQAILYAPSDLPEPTSPEFGDAFAERTIELVEIADGGALVLTTSLRAMHDVSDKLRERFKARVLVQGDAPKTALLDRFRAMGDGILCATMGFWEGVDVPGAALRLVVIDKIPFAVPTDPLHRARSKRYEERGENAFLAYAVPQATILLRQGVGRLIRTRNDVGIVAILDRRLRGKPYGFRILSGLLPLRPLVDIARVKLRFVELVRGTVPRRVGAPTPRTDAGAPSLSGRADEEVPRAVVRTGGLDLDELGDGLGNGEAALETEP